MTLTTTTSRVDYPGADTTGPFDYPFKIYDASDLEVFVLDAQNVETELSYPADFTVTGVRNGAGGTITTSTAVATGETITIRRVRPTTQLVKLTDQGPFLPGNYEDALDKLAMVGQQLTVDTSRAVRLPNSTDPSDFDATLPTGMVAGDTLTVNATGNGFSMTTATAPQLTAWNATHNQTVDVFTSPANFTAGVTTSLTLSSDPGNENNLQVTFDVAGVVTLLQTDDYSVSGTTLTFTSPITAGTTRVEVKYLYTYQVNITQAENVSYAQTGTGAITRDVRARLRETVSVKDFGAVGDGTTDDTAACQAAIDAVTSAHGTVHIPSGTYKITSTLTVPSYVNLVGDGSSLSTLSFAPSADDTCVSVTAGVAESVLNRIRGIGFYDPNFSHTNVALELSDVSSCVVDDIYVYGAGSGTPSGPYWKGTGLLTKGREATSVSNVRLVCKGGHSINIAANPNTARTDGEDIDHWSFHNCYLVTDNTSTFNNIKVDDGIGLIDLSFSGYQAWVGSASHFVWNDSRIAPTIVSRNVSFENVRTEQCGTTAGWGFDLTWTQPIETITIRNALISATSQGISLNGFLQARLETVIAATGASPLCSLKLAGATGGSTLSIADSYWQPGSAFTTTGYNLVFAPTFAASVTVGPSNGIYANTYTGSLIQLALVEALCTAAAKGLKVFASAGDGLTVLPQAAGSGVVIRSENTAETDFQDMSLVFDGLTLKQRTGVATAGTIIEVGTGTTPKLGFYGVTPIARALLATGAGHSVDNVITALQNLGLVRQS